MNEKFNFHLSFGVFTPKLWYETLFRTVPSTAAKDEQEEMESLEYEFFNCWNETEEAFGDLVPLGIYEGVEDTESVVDDDGANLEDFADEDDNSNEEIEIEIAGDDDEDEDVDIEYTPAELRENDEDNLEIEDREIRITSFLNERINDSQDSFLSTLDNSFPSS